MGGGWRGDGGTLSVEVSQLKSVFTEETLPRGPEKLLPAPNPPHAFPALKPVLPPVSRPVPAGEQSRLDPLESRKDMATAPNDPFFIDGSPPGSPVPGTLQARTLEWVTRQLSRYLSSLSD